MCPKISLDKREYPNGGGSLTEYAGKTVKLFLDYSTIL